MRKLPNKRVIGGYVSYFRAMAEPCRASALNADIETMELLGMKLSVPYVIARIERVLSRR